MSIDRIINPKSEQTIHRALLAAKQKRVKPAAALQADVIICRANINLLKQKTMEIVGEDLNRAYRTIRALQDDLKTLMDRAVMLGVTVEGEG
jgi:hypothetical protein